MWAKLPDPKERPIFIHQWCRAAAWKSDTLNIAATELSKVESLCRELMANISHDLRTPLSLIYSCAEMMHDFPDEITPVQTQTIMDESQRQIGDMKVGFVLLMKCAW